MKPRLVIAIMGLLLVAGVFFGEREPRCQGRSLSEWAEAGLTLRRTGEVDLEALQAVRSAIARIGPEAVPWVLRWTGPEKEPIRSVRRWWNRAVPRSWIWSPEDKYEQGFFVAECVGEHLASRSDELVRRTRVGYPSGPRLLMLLSPAAALPIAVEFVQSSNRELRALGLRLISHMGNDGSPAVSLLLSQAERETDTELRDEIHLTVLDTGSTPAATLGALERALTQENPDIARANRLAAALRLCGSDGVSALGRALDHPHPNVKNAARWACDLQDGNGWKLDLETRNMVTATLNMRAVRENFLMRVEQVKTRPKPGLPMY